MPEVGPPHKNMPDASLTVSCLLRCCTLAIISALKQETAAAEIASTEHPLCRYYDSKQQQVFSRWDTKAAGGYGTSVP